MLGHLWLSLLVGAAAQVEVNEVGLSLAKAFAASSVQAHVDIAKMTGDLMAKQKQLSTAKLKVEQLITEERAFAKRTDLLEQQESRMEEMLKLHGSVSEKASQAKAKAQAFQKQMLSQEAEVKALQEAIKSQSSLLKSSEEKLQLLKQKEDDYSHGARLAVLKSNKLERDLKDARIELEKKKANFTEQHEVAEIAAAKRDSVHRIQEHQKEENEESSQWIAAHRGEATVINEQTISMAENDVENAKELLKQSRQKTKEQAEANAKAVAQQRQKFLEWEMASAEAMKQAQAQLQSAREDQEKALAAASRRIQSSLTDVNAAERTMRAKSELKSVNAKLAEEEKKLKQQHLENKAKAQEISKETAQMDATKKKHESTMKSEMEKEEQKMKKMKMDAQEMWKKDRAAEANMETTLHKVRSDKEHEKRQVEEVDAELRRARKRLQKAQVKLQIAEQQGKQQQLDYEQKMYQGLLIVIPIFVGWFVTGYGEGPHSVRQVGLTEFALPENYDEFKITEQHREEFFRDGASLLKGVLRPSMVAKLRAVVERRQPQLTPPTSSNLWMDSDELLDFYLFGPLGGIAAQLFQSRDAVTSHLAPSAQLQRDFISKRYQEATNGWHIDRTECQGGDQPSKFMSTALPRLAIPLDAQAVRGTQIINQSKYAAALSAKDAELYWAGKAPYRREGRFEPFYGFEYNTSVPILPGITLKEDMIMEHWVEPGDVVIFNTCLWHRSPDWAGPEPELGLQPTFANVKAEEHAQEEVEKLQIEFHQLHEDKNAKITELSHKLEETRAGKLRGS
ncbi:unnamed protein product [Durusdinium trenchii]|uniref:Uncharacterized protein n=1 Tax=Durusdinium trenchii TaxID=1381693 RepID=A0ABP0K8U0_9DINO